MLNLPKIKQGISCAFSNTVSNQNGERYFSWKRHFLLDYFLFSVSMGIAQNSQMRVWEARSHFSISGGCLISAVSCSIQSRLRLIWHSFDLSRLFFFFFGHPPLWDYRTLSSSRIPPLSLFGRVLAGQRKTCDTMISVSSTEISDMSWESMAVRMTRNMTYFLNHS